MTVTVPPDRQGASSRLGMAHPYPPLLVVTNLGVRTGLWLPSRLTWAPESDAGSACSLTLHPGQGSQSKIAPVGTPIGKPDGKVWSLGGGADKAFCSRFCCFLVTLGTIVSLSWSECHLGRAELSSCTSPSIDLQGEPTQKTEKVGRDLDLVSVLSPASDLLEASRCWGTHCL